MRFLITAGPTREYLDAIRFISNPSSGTMGYSLARIAQKLGHKVTLVTGPTNLSQPRGVRVIKIETAQAMRTAVRKSFGPCDCLIMAAAVSDYRPGRKFNGKMKKKTAFNLRLVRNPDILSELSRNKGRRIMVGFALEITNGRRNALRKLHQKRLDYIVFNTPTALGSNRTTAEILSPQKLIKQFRNVPKTILSHYLIRLIEKDIEVTCGSRPALAGRFQFDAP